jgi:hypothetical protein
MNNLRSIIAKMAPDFGILKESEAEVIDRLNRAAAIDEVDTVAFGLETDDGRIVKVYVAEKDSDRFEELMSQALGKVDDIEEAINLAAKEVEIIDVEWPIEANEPKPEDGSEVLNPQVYNNAKINQDMKDELKPKLEGVVNEAAVGISSRLATPNQQLILQAVLELGIPEIALERSPYKANIVRNIRELALQLQHNAAMKQALRIFVKRSIDFTKGEEEVTEAVLSENLADFYWSAVEKLLLALDTSTDKKVSTAIINSSKYAQLKRGSTAVLNNAVDAQLRTKLTNMTSSLSQLNRPVTESLNGNDLYQVIVKLISVADRSVKNQLANSLFDLPEFKQFKRILVQHAASIPSSLKQKIEAVAKELMNANSAMNESFTKPVKSVNTTSLRSIVRRMNRINESKRDPEIIDAASSVGTVAELTDSVYKRVVVLMSELKTISDGDLAAMIRLSKGEEKFAIRVALTVIGRREPSLK